ncbi:MAG: AAA family ATPase [Planctomycetes bacterium]|nr:AAA family ATPase [Planctomycetota bacterium]
MKAQVALSKEFLKAYSDLPKPIQKKVREFTERFRHDPTGSGINFERLEGVADDKVRSVRIDKAYRAIVVHPPKGDVFLCVWVDHHDEAYAWVRNRRFEVHPASGALQVYDVENVAAPASAAAPARARTSEGLFAGVSDEDLLLAGVPAALLRFVRAVREEPELEAIAPSLPEDAAEILVGLAAGYSLTEALEMVERGPKVEPVDVADFAAALERPVSQQTFRIVEDDSDLSRILDEPLAQWRIFLHPTQRKLVESRANGPMRVLGGAGTGKTVVLMHRTRHLARVVFRSPDDRILVTTFTRNLALELEASLRRLCGAELERIEVVNLHSWIAQYLRRHGHEFRIADDGDVRRLMQQAVDEIGDAGLPHAFFLEEWRRVVQPQELEHEAGYLRARRVGRGVRVGRRQRVDVWRVFARFQELLREERLHEWPGLVRTARALLERHGRDVPYRAVLADEVQDMAAGDLRLLRAMVPEGPDDLFLVGDGHQRIYGQPVAMGACGIQIRGRSRRLKVNYRTTEQIRALAVGVLAGQEVDDLDGGIDSLRGYTSLRAGPRPVIRSCRSEAAEAQVVVETVRAWLEAGCRPHEICVAARTGALVKERYRRILEAAGLRVAQVEADADDALPEDAVRIATMHRLKGLEFPRVLLAGVQEGRVPLEIPDADEAGRADRLLQERCLFYVAATRARDELVVTGYGKASPFLAGT